MQFTEAYQSLRNELTHLYEPREANTIADWIIESITGLSKSRRLIANNQILNENEKEKFFQMKEELLHGRPVQYVIGKTEFCNLSFQVDERVLIPRPETEELVVKSIDLIQKEKRNTQATFRILDIGTGSGCIAICLKKRIPDAEVIALDCSNETLNLAKSNAINNQVSIQFIQKNILEEAQVNELPCFNFIVSNPPYIPPSDKDSMGKNVLDFEPHTALFTSEQNPLQFYEAIIAFSKFHLTRGGYLAFETHCQYANAVADLLSNQEFEEIEVAQDLQGKNRMVFAKKSGSSL
jgi:release factor glutamine methyltransferase